ncbi:MAG: tetratricopeptide repeat protein [Synechococcales bacterium]|nr:tetratricopeptide repeat protein [Synechococcales bacterium]
MNPNDRIFLSKLNKRWMMGLAQQGLGLGTIALWLAMPLAAVAQSNLITVPGPVKPGVNEADAFPVNPLEIKEPDPLLPNPDRPLSTLERQRLQGALEAMNLQAAVLLQAEKPVEAFALWNRELRLRRSLGLLEETTALGRVGAIAWQQSQTQQLRYINQRLAQIQAQMQGIAVVSAVGTVPAPEKAYTERDRETILDALGLAYELVRKPDLALTVYQPKLREARQKRDRVAEFNALNSIGVLHLDWFKYPQAQTSYQELLAVAQQNQDLFNQAVYLIQLAYIHEQSKQPAQAAAYLEQLLALYQDQPEVLPAIQLRLAENYDAANQFEAAERNYQQTYTLTQTLVQSSYSADALQKLGALYRRYDRLAAAQQVFDFLVDYEQSVFNYYGAMRAADQLGQVRLQQQDLPGAIAAFERGLAFAQELKLRPDYFQKRIQTAQTGKANPTPSHSSTP